MFARNGLETAVRTIRLQAFRIDRYFEEKRLTERQQAQGVAFVMGLTAFWAIQTSGNIIKPRKEPLITNNNIYEAII